MATQTVEFRAASGLTLTVRLFAVGSDTIVQTASACTEATNRKGTYAAVFTDPGAAEFELVALSGGVPVCRWFVTLTLSTATFQAYDGPAKLAAITHTGARVPNVTLVDTTTTNTDMRGTDNAALASAWTSTRAGYLDSVLLAANSNQRTVQVTGSNHVAADIHELQPSVITSAAFAAGWLTAAGTAADYVTELQTAIGTAANQTAILDRLGAFTGSGVNTVLGFLKAIASKAASTPSDIGGTFSATTDSVEAIRDAMQAGTGDASQATLVQVQGTVDAIAASLSGTAINVVSRVADGGDITLYTGDDMRVRSGTEVAVTISDVGGAIYTRLNAIGVAQLAFGAARPSQPAGAITGTIASLSQAGSGSSQTVTINIEIEDSGERLAPADNYVWQIVSSDAQGAEYDTYTEVEGMLTLKRRVAVPLYS